LAQAVGPEELPLVELGTVGQGKSGQEVVAVHGYGFGQRRDTGGTDRAGSMWMILDFVKASLKLLGIYPEIGGIA
jgi:hypothetical protein